MDPSFREALAGGAEALGLALSPEAFQLLERFADRLLAWNRKVNLTAITAPGEVAEKHLLDSLVLLRSLGSAHSVLDVGSGGGLPGMALACARPELSVVCCDSVAKKVSFVKAVAVELGLLGVRGVVARAEGEPEAEGLPRSDVVVSRALADPAVWVPLGSAYLAPGGALLAMLGKGDDEAKLAAVGAGVGLELAGVERYELPFSGSARAIARWVAPGR
jgi:16S rRNA (guanine527-N7)-methyltransferase